MVFVMDTECVLCEVGFECLSRHIIYMSVFKGLY